MTVIPVKVSMHPNRTLHLPGAQPFRVQLMQSKHMYTMDFYLRLICVKYVANLPVLVALTASGESCQAISIFLSQLNIV